MGAEKERAEGEGELSKGGRGVDDVGVREEEVVGRGIGERQEMGKEEVDGRGKGGEIAEGGSWCSSETDESF